MSAPNPKRRVLRWDPDVELDEGDMEFRLTYAGPLYAYRTGGSGKDRSLHIHSIRKVFHKQLAALWAKHPVLSLRGPSDPDVTKIPSCGFTWLPIATKHNGLICRLEILMLRNSEPGRVLADIDNRLKSVFDALRMADSPEELGSKTQTGQVMPDPDETPFYTLLQDDRLITHVAVTTDTLLEPVPNVPIDNAARLLIGVVIRPYGVHMDNMDFI